MATTINHAWVLLLFYNVHFYTYVVNVIKYMLFQIAGHEINLSDFHVEFKKTVHNIVL